jgi:hypothetical protein
MNRHIGVVKNQTSQRYSLKHNTLVKKKVTIWSLYMWNKKNRNVAGSTKYFFCDFKNNANEAG